MTEKEEGLVPDTSKQEDADVTEVHAASADAQATDMEEDVSADMGSGNKAEDTGHDDEDDTSTAKKADDTEVDEEDEVVSKPRRARRQGLSDSEEEAEIPRKLHSSRVKAFADSEDEEEAPVRSSKPAKGGRLRAALDSDDDAEKAETANAVQEDSDAGPSSKAKSLRRTQAASVSDDGSDLEASKAEEEEKNSNDPGSGGADTSTGRNAKKAKMQELAELARKRAEQAEKTDGDGDGDGEEEEEATPERSRKRKSRREQQREREKEKERERQRRDKEKEKAQKKKKDKKKKDKQKKNASAKPPAPALKIEDLVTQQLEKIISEAVHTGDTNLTLRVCKDKLSELFGNSTMTELRKYVKEEVGRISAECQQLSAEEVKEMATSCKEVTAADLEALNKPPSPVPSESSSSESEAPPESSEPESDDSLDVQAKRSSKKARKAVPKSTLFDGIVAVPAGILQNDKAAWEKLKDLIEQHGGKVQSTVTSKVKYVVVARSQKMISSTDSRVKTARKHGARIVLDHFFTESIDEKVLQSPADYMAGIGEASTAVDSDEDTAPKAKSKKARKERAEGEEGLEGEGDDEEPKKRRRRVHKKSAEEDEWTKEFRARFGYRQDARSRPFDPKDPVVPEATFYQSPMGIAYNAYLTQTEAVEEESNHTKFYSFKLVEAGGFMKGEKWHLVSQWGKVGSQKPGCDVVDFTDLKEAKAAFHQKFWEKTRNSWEAGSFAFRTVSGKYSLVELSDDEDEEELSDSELSKGDSELQASVQRVLRGLMGREQLHEAVSALEIDTHKMPLRRLKRYRINEALAELSSIQALLQKGDKKSTKDIQKLSGHSERLRNILPSSKHEPIETVPRLKERAAMLEDLGEVCVASALRKRAMAAVPQEPSPSKIDKLYQALKTRISPIPESGETYSSIRMMVAGTQAPETPSSSFSLRLDRVFSVNRAGDDMRFAAFKRLPNRMMLWKGGRPSTIASALGHGLRVPLQETPTAGYIFGKGIYLHDCVSEAVSRSHLPDSNGEGWLLLCEAALGSVKESTRPSAMRRAPHGFHSVLGKGKAAHDPKETVEISTIPEGSEMVKAVVGPPVAVHGSEESPVGFNQYVFYDVAQVRPRYLVQVSLEYRGE